MTVFSTRYFYSRPRVGATCPYRTWPVTIAISTCAPAWGATYPFPQFGHCAANFYSRPRVGGDFPAQPNYPFLCHNFYSRPRMGGDLADGEGQNSYSIFLLTPPRGGRPETIEEIVNRELISTHAPHGG